MIVDLRSCFGALLTLLHSKSISGTNVSRWIARTEYVLTYRLWRTKALQHVLAPTHEEGKRNETFDFSCVICEVAHCNSQLCSFTAYSMSFEDVNRWYSWHHLHCLFLFLRFIVVCLTIDLEDCEFLTSVEFEFEVQRILDAFIWIFFTWKIAEKDWISAICNLRTISYLNKISFHIWEKLWKYLLEFRCDTLKSEENFAIASKPQKKYI